MDIQYRKSFESVSLHNALKKVGFMPELEFKFANAPDVSLNLRRLCNYDNLIFHPGGKSKWLMLM